MSFDPDPIGIDWLLHSSPSDRLHSVGHWRVQFTRFRNNIEYDRLTACATFAGSRLESSATTIKVLRARVHMYLYRVNKAHTCAYEGKEKCVCRRDKGGDRLK